MTSWPLLSVITVCRNAESVIAASIESLLASDYPAIEFIVVDGASTDATLQVVQRYRERISVLISEPDCGISDALNKGIAASTGAYHYILHADDRVFPHTFRTLMSAAAGACVVSGRVRVVDGERTVRLFSPQPALLNEKMSVPHMGTIIRKDAWAEAGGYSLDRRVAMDHLLLLKIWDRHGSAGFQTLPDIVAEYSVGGLSDRLLFKGFGEVRANLLQEGRSAWRANLAFLKLCAKGIISRLLKVVRN